MIKIATVNEIKEYYENESISQSLLKGLLSGYENFVSQSKNEDSKLYFEERESFIIGSAVDFILTGDNNYFNDTYYVSNVVIKPSAKEMSIAHQIFDELVIINQNFNEVKLVDIPDIVLKVINEQSWYTNLKDTTRLTKISEKCETYFSDLILSRGRTILDRENEFKRITSIVDSIKRSPIASKYFDRSIYEDNKYVDIYYQLPIYFTYKGLECKALLDILLVYKNEEGIVTALQPIDLKTTSDYVTNFLRSVKKFRYDIQAAFYTEALLSESETQRSIGYDPGLVKIEPFKFIVESTTNIKRPLIYKCSDSILHIGKYGRESLAINTTTKDLLVNEPQISYYNLQPNIKTTGEIKLTKEIKGFDKLIEEYKYYKETEWEEDKLVTESNGIMNLEWE